MPSYQVCGCRESDGADVTLTLDASDAERAAIQANAAGVLVHRVELNHASGQPVILRFDVDGVDQQTGEPLSVRVLAVDRSEAEAKARVRGIEPRSVVEIHDGEGRRRVSRSCDRLVHWAKVAAVGLPVAIMGNLIVQAWLIDVPSRDPVRRLAASLTMIYAGVAAVLIVWAVIVTATARTFERE